MSTVKSDVMFEVKKEHLETGMRGFPVGYCVTSSVHPQKGLFYMGESIEDFASSRPEEVIYLLWNGRKGSKSEVSEFAQSLANRSQCKRETIEHIRALPKDGHPMKLMCSALLIAGMLEATGDYEEDALNIIAKMPQLAATVITYHAGWEMRESDPSLGYSENFSHMLNVPGCDENRLSEVMRLFNVLHYDHGGGNLSCFTGKAIASGLEDMYGSLSGALAALAGPRHGKANQDGLEFVQQVLNQLGERATGAEVEEYIRKKLANKELIYGFGHAVLRVEDLRASLFYKLASAYYPEHPLIQTALLLRTHASKVLKENPKVSNPYPNVDAISGSILSAAGFDYPEYYTVLFGLSRVVGIAIQIVYERKWAREGKGTPIVRPKYLFKERNG